MPQIASEPVFLTIAQAASLLKVSERTIQRWIQADQIPYVKLPSGTYRISQSALLASLQSNYDLSGDLAFLDERAKGISEQDVIDALEDD
jgi:excisionase family DNA binding protein